MLFIYNNCWQTLIYNRHSSLEASMIYILVAKKNQNQDFCAAGKKLQKKKNDKTAGLAWTCMSKRGANLTIISFQYSAQKVIVCIHKRKRLSILTRLRYMFCVSVLLMSGSWVQWKPVFCRVFGPHPIFFDSHQSETIRTFMFMYLFYFNISPKEHAR